MDRDGENCRGFPQFSFAETYGPELPRIVTMEARTQRGGKCPECYAVPGRILDAPNTEC